MYYTPGWGSLATSIIALSAIGVSTYWNRRTLSAAGDRAKEERDERQADRKRQALSQALGAGGEYIDAMSAVILRVSGVTLTQGQREDLYAGLAKSLDDRLIPAKRRFLSHLVNTLLVVDDEPVINAIDEVLKELEPDLLIEAESYTTNPAEQELRDRQEKLRSSITELRNAAMDAYGATSAR